MLVGKRYVFILDDVVNLGFEIYIKYVIGFVKDKIFDVVEGDVIMFYEVD